jgi:aspartate-semialdehyde dehydrogenase
MSDARLPCAIIGASGYIGQHFARLLAAHPLFEPVALVASDRSRGRRIQEVWSLEEAPPRTLATQRLDAATPADLARRQVRVAFSALPSGTAGPFESELVRRGVHVFTNASDHRMDPKVPLVIPEINSAHLRDLPRRSRSRGMLVANANCSATGLLLAIAPVLKPLEPRTVHVSTYQALSGAGIPGIASLSGMATVVPYIPQEEEKIARESSKILGAVRSGKILPRPLPILAQCARVGVRDGHLQAVTIEAGAAPSRAELERAWKSFDPLAGRPLPTAPHPPIELRAARDRPQPERDVWAGRPATARGMAATIGRIRWEAPYLRFFTLSHNAVRGGAGGSVLNAEAALDLGLLGAPTR